MCLLSVKMCSSLAYGLVEQGSEALGSVGSQIGFVQARMGAAICSLVYRYSISEQFDTITGNAELPLTTTFSRYNFNQSNTCALLTDIVTLSDHHNNILYTEATLCVVGSGYVAKKDYCVQCWCPTPRFGNWGLILSIEKVQRKFTRLVNDIGTLSYGARLKSLKLTTLAERRMRGNLNETFKVVRGFVNYGQLSTTV